MKITLENINKFHNEFLNIVHEIDSDEIKASLLQSISRLNWKLHTGRFFCDIIETELINIGQRNKVNLNVSSTIEKDVLHIASELHEIGGHTRLLESYLDVFDSYKNDLLITRQIPSELPFRIVSNTKINKIICADKEETLIEKAIKMAVHWRNYKYVILHIHPDDIVPNIAFGIFSHKNILFVNHADHVFWIGKNILKKCINIRPLGNKISEQLRDINNNLLIPVLMRNESLDRMIQRNCRDKKKIIFGSMTSLYKILPNGNKNFLDDIYLLLDKYPKSEFHLIGIEKDDLTKFGYESNLNQRLILHGHIENPSGILEKIDIYLEGYPYNSLTALYEAVISGACPVLMYELENENCNLETDLSFDGILFHSERKEKYFNHIQKLVDSNTLRFDITSKIQGRMKQFNSINYAKEKIFSELVEVQPKKDIRINNSSLSKQTFLFDYNQFKLVTNPSILSFLDVKYFKQINRRIRFRLLKLFLIFQNEYSNIFLNIKLLK